MAQDPYCSFHVCGGCIINSHLVNASQWRSLHTYPYEVLYRSLLARLINHFVARFAARPERDRSLRLFLSHLPPRVSFAVLSPCTPISLEAASKPFSYLVLDHSSPQVEYPRCSAVSHSMCICYVFAPAKSRPSGAIRSHSRLRVDALAMPAQVTRRREWM